MQTERTRPPTRAELPPVGHGQPLALPQTPPALGLLQLTLVTPTGTTTRRKATQPPNKATSLGAAREIILPGFSPPHSGFLLQQQPLSPTWPG